MRAGDKCKVSLQDKVKGHTGSLGQDQSGTASKADVPLRTGSQEVLEPP